MSARSAEVTAATDRIAEVLGGLAPHDKAEVIAEMVTVWVIGHPADAREDILQMLAKAVRDMAPHLEEALDLRRQPRPH